MKAATALGELWAAQTVSLDRLSDFDADNVREGIDTGSLDAAHRAVENLAAKQSTSGTAGG